MSCLPKGGASACMYDLWYWYQEHARAGYLDSAITSRILGNVRNYFYHSFLYVAEALYLSLSK